MKQSKFIFTCNAEELCKKKNKREHVTFLCSPNCGYSQSCEENDMPDISCLSAGLNDHPCVHLRVQYPIEALIKLKVK